MERGFTSREKKSSKGGGRKGEEWGEALEGDHRENWGREGVSHPLPLEACDQMKKTGKRKQTQVGSRERKSGEWTLPISLLYVFWEKEKIRETSLWNKWEARIPLKKKIRGFAVVHKRAVVSYFQRENQFCVERGDSTGIEESGCSITTGGGKEGSARRLKAGI